MADLSAVASGRSRMPVPATTSYIALLSQRLIAVVACGQNCVRKGYFYFQYGAARAL